VQGFQKESVVLRLRPPSRKAKPEYLQHHFPVRLRHLRRHQENSRFVDSSWITQIRCWKACWMRHTAHSGGLSL